MELHDLWNAILSVGILFGGYMLNRVTTILDKLQVADAALSRDIADMKIAFVPKNEFMSYGDRLEKRLESYQMLQMETSKTMFAKLDNISDRLADKVSRGECVANMSKVNQ